MRLHRNLVSTVIDSIKLIFNEGEYADKVVQKALKRDARWGARDRKFVAETIYEMVRWKRLYNEIAGTKCQIRDTRKTTPGLRQLEKFAVRMGGAVNHRLSLSESALIKDNHIVAAGSISAAFAAIKKMFPGKSIEIEVDSIDQLKEAIALNLDGFSMGISFDPQIHVFTSLVSFFIYQDFFF